MSSRIANKFPIPLGFPEILHDYAREVVRYRPKDILDFSIQYFYFIEKALPPHYTEGGSAQIPKIEYDQIENDTFQNTKKGLKKREISSPSITTDQATGNMFYKSSSEIGGIPIKKNIFNNINDKNNNNLITPIASERDSYGNENLNNDNIKRNPTPGSTFSGISGTESQKGQVRTFIRDVIKTSEDEVNEKLKNDLLNKENEKQLENENRRLSTFSNVSGTSSQKGDVRNFVGEVIKDSINDVNGKMKGVIEEK